MEKQEDFIPVTPGDVTVQKFHGLMLGAIGPRPIAFASTIDAEGRPNLSPFSFFNCFGANPPILVFSPSRRGRDGSTKDTYENVKVVPEVVINTVSYGIVKQMNLASSEFPRGVNEFEKAGLTMIRSDLVRPYRVAESFVQFECRVLQLIETGSGKGSGNLVVCEVLRMHVNPSVLGPEGKIDPHRMDLVGRLGGDTYVRARGDALFELPKPD